MSDWVTPRLTHTHTSPAHIGGGAGDDDDDAAVPLGQDKKPTHDTPHESPLTELSDIFQIDDQNLSGKIMSSSLLHSF